MKVKALDAISGSIFGGRIGRGWVAEGLRSASVTSVWAARRSIGVNWAVFGRAGLAPAAGGVSTAR
jgi:hypothetical protein